MNAPLHAGMPREVRIDDQLGLAAILGIPQDAIGLVIFAHGSGSGRRSPRNNYVAARLRKDGMATLLLDLLTPHEEQNRRNVFEEPGALNSVVDLASAWFLRYLREDER